MDQANIKDIQPVSVDNNKVMVYYKNNRAELLTKEQVAEKLGGAY